MKYVEPVYDRTQEDVDNKTSKAFFNIADWKRVNDNSQILALIVGYFINDTITLTPVANPTITNIPTVNLLNNILDNLELIRTSSGLPLNIIPALEHDWQAGSGAHSPDFEDANQWEENIALIIRKIEGTVQYRAYCGVPSVGQTRFYQARWRVFAVGIPDSLSPVRRTRMNVGYCGTGSMRMNGFRRYD